MKRIMSSRKAVSVKAKVKALSELHDSLQEVTIAFDNMSDKVYEDEIVPIIGKEFYDSLLSAYSDISHELELISTKN